MRHSARIKISLTFHEIQYDVVIIGKPLDF